MSGEEERPRSGAVILGFGGGGENARLSRCRRDSLVPRSRLGPPIARPSTSFVFPDEAVDRLRVAAKNAILVSPEIKRLISNGALRVVGPGPHVGYQCRRARAEIERPLVEGSNPSPATRPIPQQQTVGGVLEDGEYAVFFDLLDTWRMSVTAS